MGVDVKIDLNADSLKKIAEDRIIGPLIGAHKYVIVIDNKTGVPLRRVDSYNDSEHWSINDVPTGEVAACTYDCKSFSVAAKYQGGGNTFVLAASSPLWGKDKIELKDEDLNTKIVWEKMDDGRDKNTKSGSRAYITNIKGTLTWVFELVKK